MVFLDQHLVEEFGAFGGRGPDAEHVALAVEVDAQRDVECAFRDLPPSRTDTKSASK
jgi:hypothetical protein